MKLDLPWLYFHIFNGKRRKKSWDITILLIFAFLDNCLCSQQSPENKDITTPSKSEIKLVVCSESEFHCISDNKCIPKSFMCDLSIDCSNGEDENLSECDLSKIHPQRKCDTEDTFHCTYSRKCIPKDWTCDGIFDCGFYGNENKLDSSDESFNCSANCGKNQLLCSDNVCLPISRFCNKVQECANDEQNCEDRSPCKSLNCSYDCRMTVIGPKCYCPENQQVVNETECEDFNECTDKDEACDQLCENLPNTFKCKCIEGYERLNKNCYASTNNSTDISLELFLLTTKELVKIVLTRDQNMDINDVKTQILNLQSPISMDINQRNGSACVLENAKITCYNTSNFLDKWVQPAPDLFPNLESISQITLDWISGNWYYMDSMSNMVFVCTSEMKHCRIIVPTDLGFSSKFRHFVIDPNVGYLFLTKYNLIPNTSAIVRLSMDGSKVTNIITDKILYPNDITLDLGMQQIYFLDDFFDFIQQCDYDGKNRKFLQKMSNVKLHTATFFENFFYGVSPGGFSLIRLDKADPTSRKDLYNHSDYNTKALKIFHRQIQLAKSEICANASKCDHLCIPVYDENVLNLIEKCFCGEGFQMSKSGKCEQNVPEKFLIFVKNTPKMIKAIALNEKPIREIMMPITNVQTLVSFDVDAVNKVIYFSRQNGPKRFSIELQSFDGSNRRVILSNLTAINGIAWDSFGKNVFYITTDSINAIKMSSDPKNNLMLKTLLNRDIINPMSMTLNVEGGWIYWSSWAYDYKQGGKIEAAWMDGTNRKIIAQKDHVRNISSSVIYWPVSLTFDAKGNKLYWWDAVVHTLECLSFDNNARETIFQAVKEFFPYAVYTMDNLLYFSDHQKGLIEQVLINSTNYNNDKTLLYKESGVVTQLKPVVLKLQMENLKDQEFYSKCPGLVLRTPTKSSNCMCGDDLSKNALGTDCIPSITNKKYDEKSPIVCVEGEFKCQDGKKCIKNLHLCDGEFNCKDKSDEVDAPDGPCQKPPCDFKCDGSRCLVASQVCNSQYECVDGTDEAIENCPQNKTIQDCEFICSNGNCIDLELICNGENECGDNSDELNCKYEATTNGPIISLTPPELIDVEDFDDDEDFPNEYTEEFNAEENCKHPNYLCLASKRCIPVHKLCNGIFDCADHSDEEGRCNEKLCNHVTQCSHFCHNSPHAEGYVCSCPSHMFLEADRSTCGSARTCDNFASCSHSCQQIDSNNIRCHCYNNYRLAADNFTCESTITDDAIILFSNKHVIRGLNLRTKSVQNYFSLSKNLIALDFYYNRNVKTYEIFWSDVFEDKIFNGVVKNDELLNIKPVVESGLSTTESVAVDWIGQNIYWVDSVLRQIEVARKNGLFRKTLISDTMYNPRSIALDPRIGYLFWSDWGEENPCIERASMSGDDRKIIFYIKTIHGAWPNGLTLDYTKKRIFFLDAQSKDIHTINYDGEDHKKILKNPEYLSHPFAISVFENHIFWTDWRLNGVLRTDKFTGNNVVILYNATTQPFDLKVMHPSRQPWDLNGEGTSEEKQNPCGEKNGNCSHLCLLSTLNTFKCDCPHFFRLASDERNCENIENLMIYISGAAEIKGVDLKHPYSLAISTIKHATEVISPTHLDFNPRENRLYWSDTQLNELKSIQLSTNLLPSSQKLETIIDTAFDKLNGFAVDYVSELIFFMHKIPDIEADTGVFKSYRLMATNLKGEFMTKILDNLNEIYSFIVSPEQKIIYYSMLLETDKNFTINQCLMDGSELTSIITEDEIIQSLSLDLVKNRLYFVKNYRKIFYFDFKTKRTTLVNVFYGKFDQGTKYNNIFINSLVVHQDLIYFGESYTNSILSCNRDVCLNPIVYRNNTIGLKQLKIMTLTPSETPLLKNGCSKFSINSKSKCQHLCLPIGNDHVCSCALGYTKNQQDPAKCVGNDDFLIYNVGYQIKGLSLSLEHTDDVLIPLQKIHEISSFDFDAKSDYFYFSDNDNSEIIKIKKDGSDRQVLLNASDIPDHSYGDWLGGVAVDWIADNLYWTDHLRGLIEVSRLNGAFRYVISSQLNRPNLIALDPVLGVLFYLNGDNKIVRQSMDGGLDKFYVNILGESNYINHFVLDTSNQMIFWCEAKTSKIWKVDYDGNEMKQLDLEVFSPISLAFSNGKLYWLERSSNTSIKMVKNMKYLNETVFLRTNLTSQVKGIIIYSSRKQRGNNLCSMPYYGGCEELCLFNGNNATCHCSNGYVDVKNGKSCQSYKNFLFYSRIETIEKMLVISKSDNNSNNFNISNKNFLKNAIALTYDYENKLIYYSDLHLNGIFSCDFFGKNFRQIVRNQLTVEGITFNPLNNRIFWTLNTDAQIRSIDLNLFQNKSMNPDDGQIPPDIIMKFKKGDDKLRAITLEPCLNMLYWTNWGKSPSIQRAYVTGAGREDIITKDITMPNAITLDYVDKRLFWADARLDKIERCNYDGKNRIVLAHSSPKHPFSITIFGDYIFWSDWILHGVLRANKYSGNDVTFLKRDIQKPMGIIIVQETIQNCSSTRCGGVLNGGCEDLCLPHGMDEVKCECTQGVLDKSGKRCLKRQKDSICDETKEFECGTGDCVPYELTCDKAINCLDESDEETTYCATRKCPIEHFFQCQDFKCISKELVCNGIHNCQMGEDEENCKCKDTEYKCGSGECISKKFVCDYDRDCRDVSDEINCEKRDCNLGSVLNSTKQLLNNSKYSENSNFIQCEHTTACILPSWICDGFDDCWDNSDEKNCEEKIKNSTCPTDKFQCPGGNCIPFEWVCDFESDCDLPPSSSIRDVSENSTSLVKPKVLPLFSADEQNCQPHCQKNQFRCPNSSTCIPLSWMCDSIADCPGGDDELSCAFSKCDEWEFKCNKTLKCISKKWRCDGQIDCDPNTDDSDEKDCEGQVICEPDQFQCNSYTCIENFEVCDGNINCPGSEDEGDHCDTGSYNSNKKHGCNHEDEFQCKDLECIDKNLVCNSKRDCFDGTDELEDLCKNFTYDATRCADNPEMFQCLNKACIEVERTCDLLDDCGDFSDEQNCNINECEYVECQHECVDLKIGYKCVCHSGFAVEEDNPNLCKDIDECISRPCSQICINTHGSYKCECYDKFVKKNQTMCKADSAIKSKIIFSNRYYIRAVDFQGKVEILAHNLSNAVALDFDWKQKYLYYSDVTTTHSEISRIRLNENSTLQKEVLHQHNMKNPDGLAFDWIAKNLYWCDKGRRTIEVSQDSGRYRKMLIQENLDEPRAIVLDPYNRFFYWSDWGTTPHIGKAGMDGSQPHSIVDGQELGWPNALTISFETNELFYGDAREDYIAVCDLDGKNRKILMSRHLNPAMNLHHIFSIAVWEEKVIWSDWELKSIEYCDKYTGKNCGTLAKNEHRPMDLRVFHPFRQKILTPPLAINIKRSVNNTKSGAFRKKIESLNLEENPCAGANCEALCLLSPIAPYYKCDCPDNFVLDTKESDLKSLTGKPIHIPTLCKANCTANQFLCPKSMKCIPFFHKCDAVVDCIGEGTDAEDEPNNCRKFHCQSGQFQCDDDKLSTVKCLNPNLICDGNKNCDDGKDEDNCDNYECLINSQFKCEKSKNTTAFCINGNKRCDKEINCPNGNDEKNCPHKVCTNTQFRCNSTDTCVPNVWLCDGEFDCSSGEDERNCSGRGCPDNEFRCNNGRCLPKAWVCDNEPDCMGGEDEIKCSNTNTSSLSPCDPSYFRCNDSNCVPGRYQCDGEFDCSDGSDEINCVPRNCSESEFRCTDGQCIAGFHRCDKETHCKDFSDEIGCNITCDQNSFKCEKQLTCINKALLCNGIRDCLDYSDEKNCDCKKNEYKCKGLLEKCILQEFTCDGIPDCPKNGSNSFSSDEESCSNRSCSGNAVKCSNGNCVSKSTLCTENVDNCEELKKIYCYSKKPYNNVKIGCKFGRCSQICVENQKNVNSFQCKCASGFQKSRYSRNATCRAIQGRYLIFTASDSEFRFIFGNNLESLEVSTQKSRISSKFLGDTSLPSVHSFIITDSIKISSFDYIIDEDNNIVLYWLDQVASNILKRINIKTSKDFDDIKEHGFNATSEISVMMYKPLAEDSTVKTLALDWINSKVYFLENDMIRVVTEGNHEKSVIDAGQHSADLVLDPETRQMFWSTMLRLIYVASMDGNGKRKLVYENIEYASSLAVDHPAKRLYWCDLRKSTIETVTLDGFDRQMVRKFEDYDEFGLKISPFKIDIFEDEMFVVFSNRSIQKLNKFGYLHDSVFENGPYQNEASHIKIVHAFKRKFANNNPCVKNPCDKSAMCLLSSSEPLKRSCLCADSMYMQKNGSYIKCMDYSEVPKMCTRKCFNDGRCRFENNEQICECSSKFEGPFCEHYICSGFCLNHGICQLPTDKNISAITTKELKEQRICRCTKNYTGDRCQIPSHICKVCHNGGTCTFSLLPNNTIVEHCICALNFSGSKCENCASLQCLNQGVCRQTPGEKFVCDCIDKYSGTHCEIDKCDNFCKNNGKCHFVPVTGTNCTCVNGFKGLNCEIDEKCENYNCRNGGTCLRDDYDAVKCQCPPRYRGNKCQEYICNDHDCPNSTMPSTNFQNCDDLLHCENNGICRLNKMSEPYCECAGDWTGSNCSMPPNCVSNECGKCNEQSSINECVCNKFLIQPCLVGPDTHFDGSVIQTELPNENHEKASMILILIFLLVLLFTLVAVSVFYIRKWQRRNRFFAHARLNENVEEITNPIFDYSAAIEADDTHPVATTKFDGNNDKGHFSNPIYESMYASATHTTGLLEKKNQSYEEEEEIKN